MNKYIISVRNTANGKYENVEVTEEVYTAYMRTGWNINDNDESFFKHQIQFSALLGNIDDAVENFKEFQNIKSDTEEIAEMNIRLKMLFKALRKLSSDELELITQIYFEDKTEVECAEKYGISQQFINKKKKRILDASICRELNESKVIKNDKETKWFPTSIQYILTNEKYIGDSLWQKNYNTSMPYRKVRNKGELEKYYINNTHEAIITREEFEKVHELIEQRKHPNKNLINNYPLSKKIYCGKCGSLFKRRFINEKSYWVCREHYYNAENCQIKQIPEQAFYRAFTIMYNKLKANYSIIFTPMLTQIQELKNKKYGCNKQYIEINKEIEQLKEQTGLKRRDFSMKASI